jgi:hypothetical protein
MGLFQTDEAGLPQTGTLEMAAFAPAFAGLKLQKDMSFDRYQQALSENFDADCDKASTTVRPVNSAFLKSLAYWAGNLKASTMRLLLLFAPRRLRTSSADLSIRCLIR